MAKEGREEELLDAKEALALIKATVDRTLTDDWLRKAAEGGVIDGFERSGKLYKFDRRKLKEWLEGQFLSSKRTVVDRFRKRHPTGRLNG